MKKLIYLLFISVLLVSVISSFANAEEEPPIETCSGAIVDQRCVGESGVRSNGCGYCDTCGGFDPYNAGSVPDSAKAPCGVCNENGDIVPASSGDYTVLSGYPSECAWCDGTGTGSEAIEFAEDGTPAGIECTVCDGAGKYRTRNSEDEPFTDCHECDSGYYTFKDEDETCSISYACTAQGCLSKDGICVEVPKEDYSDIVTSLLPFLKKKKSNALLSPEEKPETECATCPDPAETKADTIVLLEGSISSKENVKKLQKANEEVQKKANEKDFSACKIPAGWLDSCKKAKCNDIKVNTGEAKMSMTLLGKVDNPACNSAPVSTGKVHVEVTIALGGYEDAMIKQAAEKVQKILESTSCPAGCQKAVTKLDAIPESIVASIPAKADFNYEIKCTGKYDQLQVKIDYRKTKECSMS